MNWLNGKKTYATMAVIIILAGINGWNEYCLLNNVPAFCMQIIVPEWVFGVLGALGIYTRKVANK